jgi:hypothetical protein
MISSKTLDANSRDYQWEDGGVVCSTDGIEDCNGIDPGAFLDPTDGELVALAAFTGGPEQLWRIDQLTDGTYRIMPKAVPESKEPLALSAIGASSPTLARFDPSSREQRWHLKAP